MFGQISNFASFFAFLINAFDVQVGVQSLKCFAEDGFDVVGGCSTAIGAFVVGLLGCPGGDAGLAEQFTAGVAFVGVQGNHGADGAHEGLVAAAYEAVWVVPALVHFCWE